MRNQGKKHCRDMDDNILLDVWEGKIPDKAGDKWQYFFDINKEIK